MSINVHIEELVLDGLGISSSQSPVVQAAVQSELARLIAERVAGRVRVLGQRGREESRFHATDRWSWCPADRKSDR